MKTSTLPLESTQKNQPTLEVFKIIDTASCPWSIQRFRWFVLFFVSTMSSFLIMDLITLPLVGGCQPRFKAYYLVT